MNTYVQCNNWISDAQLKDDVEGITFVPTLLHPNSKGVVELIDADPLSAPRINARYFTDVDATAAADSDPAAGGAASSAADPDAARTLSLTSDDARTLALGCMKVLELLEQPAFRALSGCGDGADADVNWMINIPDEHVERARRRLGLDFADATRKAVLQRAVKDEIFWTDYVLDLSSTLYHPVGTCGIGRVIDAALKVTGISGLRVCDASSMPEITSGNTAAPVYMMAEKCAQMMADEHGLTLTLTTGSVEAAKISTVPTREDGSAGGPSGVRVALWTAVVAAAAAMAVSFARSYM